MTQHEIVALRCPSCGGGITQPSREMSFGAEFRCERCGTTSVLIIDQALVPLSTLQQQGETVCPICGRVAQREARFCQGGHALVRACIKCLVEFAVDHPICDTCGWPQSVKPDSVEGRALAFERAVADLASPSILVRWRSLDPIIAGHESVSRTAVAAAASAIVSKLITDPSTTPSDVGRYWEALAKLGSSASQAVPLLKETIQKNRHRGATLDLKPAQL